MTTLVKKIGIVRARISIYEIPFNVIKIPFANQKAIHPTDLRWSWPSKRSSDWGSKNYDGL